MASAADPSLWEDSNTDTPPQQWQAVASDGRWWWSSTPAPNPITYIGNRALPAVLEIDWEIVENPEATLYFDYFLEGVGGSTIELGSSVGTGTIEIPTDGYTPGGTLRFSVYSDFTESAYEGSVALLGPDIPEAPDPGPGTIHNIHLTWTEGTAGTHPIALYRLYRSLDGAPLSLLVEQSASDSRTYSDLEVSAATYEYRVRSVDSEGNESADSNVVTIVVPS